MKLTREQLQARFKHVLDEKAYRELEQFEIAAEVLVDITRAGIRRNLKNINPKFVSNPPEYLLRRVLELLSQKPKETVKEKAKKS